MLELEFSTYRLLSAYPEVSDLATQTSTSTYCWQAKFTINGSPWVANVAFQHPGGVTEIVEAELAPASDCCGEPSTSTYEGNAYGRCASCGLGHASHNGEKVDSNYLTRWSYVGGFNKSLGGFDPLFTLKDLNVFSDFLEHYERLGYRSYVDSATIVDAVREVLYDRTRKWWRSPSIIVGGEEL